MQIVSVEFQNFKRIEVIRIVPGPGPIELTGANEQGKSTVLDGIEAVLGGGGHQPEEPIRRGEEWARGVVETEDLIVERVWTAGGKDALVVKSKDGGRYGQAKLNGLVGGLAFDALGFMDQRAADQREALLSAIGVDLDGFNARRQVAYDARRDAGRLLKAAQARLDGAPVPAEGTPDEEVSREALYAEMTEARRVEAENAESRSNARRIDSDADDAESEVDNQAANITRIEDQISALEVELEQAKAQKVLVMENAKKARAAAKKAAASAAALVDPDIDAIQLQMAEADATKAVDAEKAAALAAATMPVEGLAVTDDGVTYEGLPLSQAAMSRRVRVCTAIASALNPELRIALVRHGNDLDDDTLLDFDLGLLGVDGGLVLGDFLGQFRARFRLAHLGVLSLLR